MSKDRAALRLALIAVLLYLSLFVVFAWGFRYDMFRPDVAGFWRMSSHWGTLFSPYWVPGYPLIIMFLRMATGNQFSPVAVMWPLAAAFYVISVVVAYRLLRQLAIPHAFGFTLFYAAFPFVGLVGAIYPVATNMAMMFLLLTALAFSQERWPAFGVYAALSLVTHKALWFTLLPLFAVTFVRYRSARPFVLLSVLPLMMLWVAGTVYLDDAWWMIAWSTKNLMWSPGALPVFDGLTTSLSSRSTPKIFKGIFVLVLFLIAAASLYLSLLHRFWLGATICIATLAMTAVLNQHEVLAVAHYARPLVVPLAFAAGCVRLSAHATVPALVSAFILGVVTNFAFAIYMTTYFFTGPGEPR